MDVRPEKAPNTKFIFPFERLSMVQAHSRSVLTEPGLVQIVCLFDPLDTPFAVVDGSGYLLYGNPSFSSLLSRLGRSDSLLLFRDVVQPVGGGRLPFLESGALDAERLPYCGHCRLEPARSREEPAFNATVRLELFQGVSGGPWVALCTFGSISEISSSAGEPDAWKRIRRFLESVGEASDAAGVAATTCETLRDLAQGDAVVLYRAEDGAWIKTHELGSVMVPESPPDRIDAGDPWLFEASRLDSAVDFVSFWQYLGARRVDSRPAWIGRDAEGILLPCKTGGRFLALACVWREAQWMEPAALRDQMDLIATSAASALERVGSRDNANAPGL